ncbi:PTS glucose transporter subunit IIA [Megasphaera elsdenii]|uniref:PTS glucose transporter subunit IIA n=1 Tax=Megasphaera elsdenii TaxID=907 RepID=A0A848ERA7_MEGEL|nr:PTS glucose transporter subunit IIA [Megasphaera elsdenii]
MVLNTDTFEIRAADGEELLIHIGIDTVKLNGNFFKSCVKQEQPVKKDNLNRENV